MVVVIHIKKTEDGTMVFMEGTTLGWYRVDAEPEWSDKKLINALFWDPENIGIEIQFVRE